MPRKYNDLLGVYYLNRALDIQIFLFFFFAEKNMYSYRSDIMLNK